MQPRQILIVAGVVIVAFAVAFGIAGSGGGQEESKAASVGVEPAEVIDVGKASIDASVPAAGDLPRLEVPVEKKPDPPATSGGDGTTVPPTTTEPTPPTTTEPTPPTTTQPTPPVTTQPAPADPSPPTTSGGSGGGGPISTGGGED
jgi:hypothetical protein